MTVTIAVVNQKGGVGKTTTTVNLASALAALGKNTLIVDLDPQGHSSEHLGAARSEHDQDILTFLLDPSQIPAPFFYKQGVSVLTANLKLGQFNQGDPEGRQFQLKKVIEALPADVYDYVFIDCQPSLSLLTLNALTASDKVLLPVQSEYLALDGLSQLILTFKEVKAKLHPRLSILGIVLTMFDRRNRLSSEIQRELEKNFGSDLFDTVIPRTVRLAEAPSFQKSILEYAPDSTAARAYTKLAKEVDAKIRAQVS
jgi:chromosome partitioning protein